MAAHAWRRPVTLRAVTLDQPYASLIAELVKWIETRGRHFPWSSAIGETIAVHAGVRPLREKVVFGPPDGSAWESWPADHPNRPHPNHPGGRPPRLYNPKFAASWTPLPLGAVVATARVADVIPMIDGWDPPPITGRYIEIGTPPAVRLMGGTPACVEIQQQVPFGTFAPGRWAVLLDGVVKLAAPVYNVGGFHRGLWTVPPVDEARIREQIAA